MRQIPYDSASYRVRLEYPSEWLPSAVDKVTFAAADLSATALLVATEAKIFTANTQNGALAAGDTMLTLTTVIGIRVAPSTGDRFYIAASAAGPAEVVECQYYDSTNRYIYLTEDLRYAHSTGTGIYGCFAYHDFNVGTEATFTKGLQMVFTWQPYKTTGTVIAYPSVTERAEISTIEYGGADFENTFSFRYAREYRVIESSGHFFSEWASDARKELDAALYSRGLQMARVVDQRKIDPALKAKLRHMVTLTGGDDWEAEREAAFAEYNRQFEILTATPIWTDQDMDAAEDDEEVDDHSGGQMMNGERGI